MTDAQIDEQCKQVLSLQYMHEEILYIICSYLPFRSFLNLIIILPKIKDVHGIYNLWSLKYWCRKSDNHSHCTPRAKLRYKTDKELKRKNLKGRRLLAKFGYK